MNEFDPLRVNSYSIIELADMIEGHVVTKDEIYACGLAAPRRPQLETELNNRRHVIIEDEEDWALATRKHTTTTEGYEGYEYYLRKYDKWPPEYRGKYVAYAKAAIDDIAIKLEKLKTELFESMREEPWLFKAEGVKKLLEGVSRPEELEALRNLPDITSKFLASGQKISYEDLRNKGIIPSNIKIENLIAEDQFLVQTNISDLGTFPIEKRTDVYFFGVPRGGKSSVLAGILSNMDKRGVAIYQPHWNQNDQDLVSEYYYGLIESTRRGKFPVSTQADSISFMKLDLKLKKRQNLLTFVEIGGEAFEQVYESHKRGYSAWGELGAGSCLRSQNRKLLIFILDYSLVKGINNQSNEDKQRRVLNTALQILSTDGTGRNYSDGCTLSKVDTVAVIVTKSDLMECADRDQRTDIALKYISNNFAAFMTALENACSKFGINKAIGYKPYVMAFSLGKLLVGNTYAYDPTDSESIVNFISDVTAGENTSFLGRVFGSN